MDLLDLILLVVIAGYALRGFATGFFRQGGALGGFVLGLGLGSWLAPVTVRLADSTGGKALVALITVLAVAAAVGSAGEYLGSWLAGITKKLHIAVVDEAAGAVLSAVSVLVVAWVLASIFARLPYTRLTTQIQNSVILAALDRDLPPVPDVVARVESIVAPSGFPRVFAGIEPTPGPPVTAPTSAAVAAAAAAGAASTVKIQSVGCGGLVDGSGFVIAPNLIATNAHVVAGTSHTIVIDGRGEHVATVVSFDPNLDFAVLRTTDITDPTLPLSSSEFPRGTVGAVLGYPGGGNFDVEPAAILYEQTAIGRNIYDQALVHRQIYAIQAVVRPGNSGGPLITSDGTVIGVVFAASTTNNDLGYALTSAEVKSEAVAASSSGRVGTGSCAAE